MPDDRAPNRRLSNWRHARDLGFFIGSFPVKSKSAGRDKPEVPSERKPAQISRLRNSNVEKLTGKRVEEELRKKTEELARSTTQEINRRDSFR